MIKSFKSSTSQEQPLSQSWHSFYQQQQQEGEEGQQQQQQQDDSQKQQTQTEDPFKDLPTDNLDDATKAIVEKARVQFASQQKALADEKARAEKMTEHARRNQSVADKSIAMLRKHNLLDDNSGGGNAKTPEEQQEDAMAAEYAKNGIPPDQAKNLAKTMMIGLRHLKPSLLNEVGGVLGPAIGKLNGIASDRYLTIAAAKPETAAAFRIPGVLDSARNILDMMIQNRQDITETSVDTAIKLATGEALMKGGGDLTNLLKPGYVPPQTRQTSYLENLFAGSHGGAGNLPADLNGNNGQGGKPIPKNEDTARAERELVALMDRQIGKKS
jgi:hypothetical protein